MTDPSSGENAEENDRLIRSRFRRLISEENQSDQTEGGVHESWEEPLPDDTLAWVDDSTGIPDHQSSAIPSEFIEGTDWEEGDLSLIHI